MLTDTLQRGLPTDSLTRAIAAVFQRPEYRRSIRRTLIEEILDWIGSIFRSITSAIDAHPFLRIVIGVAVVALVGVMIARAIYVRRIERLDPLTSDDEAGGAAHKDPWNASQAAALAGDYLEAAHSLYQAVLHTLARSDRIVIESAKTVGDYTRELRRSSSKSLGLYREFARLYEPIVWGSRVCGKPEFQDLLGIASKLAGRTS